MSDNDDIEVESDVSASLVSRIPLPSPTTSGFSSPSLSRSVRRSLSGGGGRGWLSGADRNARISLLSPPPLSLLLQEEQPRFQSAARLSAFHSLNSSPPTTTIIPFIPGHPPPQAESAARQSKPYRGTGGGQELAEGKRKGG